VEEILGDRGKYPWVQAQDDDDRHPRADTPTAQNIVLATGYQNDLFDMRYMGIKGLWGSRGDYRTDADMSVSLHKNLSISSSRSGIVKIGATHVKHPNPCMVCDGRPIAGLFDGASELVDTEDFILKETFCGMRSGSRDYFPVVGSVIDVRHMLEEYPDIVRGAKPAPRYLPNVFVLNGLGGRGFVWAPIMAHWLAEHIINGANVSHSVHPDRLFLKWARKLSLT
jgi:tRNA 5-methylaminomethyl-2-thiouridine biosynthesis bifunctional protein